MTTQTTECVHHWIIATPKGPTSRGRCKRCKAVKQFANSIGFETNNINLFRGPKTNGAKD